MFHESKWTDPVYGRFHQYYCFWIPATSCPQTATNKSDYCLSQWTATMTFSLNRGTRNSSWCQLLMLQFYHSQPEIMFPRQIKLSQKDWFLKIIISETMQVSKMLAIHAINLVSWTHYRVILPVILVLQLLLIMINQICIAPIFPLQ